MKYCSLCGAPLRQAIPEGDDRPRMVCGRCATVHYVNPRTVVGCVVEHRDRLLLCRRAIAPQEGLWTVPAGFLELEESTVEGARRETREEARAEVEVTAPHAYLDVPHIGQSYALFRSRLVGEHFEPGPESREVALFAHDELPWDELAFPVIYFALRLFVDDAERGRHRVHHGVVRWNRTGSRFDWRQCEIGDHLSVEVAPPPT